MDIKAKNNFLERIHWHFGCIERHYEDDKDNLEKLIKHLIWHIDGIKREFEGIAYRNRQKILKHGDRE